MDAVLRVVTFLLAGLSFALIAWTLWRLRKPQPLRVISPLIAIVASLGVLFLYLRVLGVTVEPVALGALLAAGAAVGLIALRLVRVEIQDGKRFVKRSQWFLGVWGLALVGLQVVSALDSPDSLAAGIAGTVVSAGLMTTMNLGLLRRRFSAAPAVPAAV